MRHQVSLQQLDHHDLPALLQWHESAQNSVTNPLLSFLYFPIFPIFTLSFSSFPLSYLRSYSFDHMDVLVGT
jgi:hypothetical protein